MNDFEGQLHRTLAQLLLEHEYRHLAAIILDSEIELLYGWNNELPYCVALDIPTSAYGMVVKDENSKEVLEHAVRAVLRGHITDNDGNPLGEQFKIEYRIKLMEVEIGWQEVIRTLIVDRDSPNQGLITEKVFARKKKQPYTYNEMKFASKSEIRIAQEFESRGVLFFPLPLAVRADTGIHYKDHREVDFLVCEDGTWGILEVSWHPDRYEKDSEKDAWFKKSGILCVEHRTAEKCHDTPSEVVDEFLEILAKHK